MDAGGGLARGGRSSARIREFQRNSAFVAFFIVVCFSCFIYVTQSLRGVLIPLVWSTFFAVPLTALIADINGLLIQVCSKLLKPLRCTDERLDNVSFRAFTGENMLVMELSPQVCTLIERVNHPCRQYFGVWSNTLTPCCRRRVKITDLHGEGLRDRDAVVNRLVKNWAYYIRDPVKPPGMCGSRRRIWSPAAWSIGGSAPGGGDFDFADATERLAYPEVQVELFVDQSECYPAVLEVATGSQERKLLMGTLELDRTSPLSWTAAVVLAMAVVLGGVFIFILFLSLGATALQENSKAYKDGAQEVLAWMGTYMEDALPKDVWEGMDTKAQKFLADAIPDMATNIFAVVEGIGWQALLFFLYLSFWIFEPLPINSSVAQVFKAYFLLKTMVCLLFASLMSGLLLVLQCKFWHLFFLVTFLLNYIPEIGPLAAAALMLPAVLLDGNQKVEQRYANTVWLVVLGSLFKIVTGNVIEVQMYATRGGEFMRMHPVVLMALMMFCEQLMGLTGMFLAVPIMAAVKYYLVSVDMPDLYLDPLLTLLEGDEHGPHKNFVDRHRVANAGLSPSAAADAATERSSGSEAEETEPTLP